MALTLESSEGASGRVGNDFQSSVTETGVWDWHAYRMHRCVDADNCLCHRTSQCAVVNGRVAAVLLVGAIERQRRNRRSTGKNDVAARESGVIQCLGGRDIVCQRQRRARLRLVVAVVRESL